MWQKGIDYKYKVYWKVVGRGDTEMTIRTAVHVLCVTIYPCNPDVDSAIKWNRT